MTIDATSGVDARPTTSEPWSRIIVHADMDAFYASVEQFDNPQLKGLPVLVGPRSRRGVVLTASYEARPFKVGSAMPMALALERCPQAVVVPPRFDRYAEVSTKVMRVFQDFSPSVEALSLDEAFLDMTGSSHLFGSPAEMGQRIRDSVRAATGLDVSVGVAASKYVAKVASGECKPRGLLVVPPHEAIGWLARLPVARLWGAGPKTQARLQAAGYYTIGDIAAADPALLVTRFGAQGRHFHDLAHARDPRRVEGNRRARSLGSERTLARDVIAPADIASHLKRSADRIARRLRSKGLLAGGVRVRLKTTRFKLLTRQCTLSEPTDVAETLYRAGIELLERFGDRGPFRLVGMAAHSLRTTTTPAQLDLLDDGHRRRLETTLDELASRFGEGAVRRARDLTSHTVLDTAPDLDAPFEDQES